MISTTKRIYFLIIICFITIFSTYNQIYAQQLGTNTFYYKFDTKVSGRFALDQLVVKLKPNIDLEGFALFFGGTILSDEEDEYIQRFEQEGLSFIQSSSFSRDPFAVANDMRQSPGVEVVGVPFFLDGTNVPVIITDEFIVRFKPEITASQIDFYNQTQQVEVVKRNPFVSNQFLISVSNSSKNALQMANDYQESGLVVFSHPNCLVNIEYNYIPSDTNFSEQWHLNNDGTTGTIDADIDAIEAWDITRGDPSVVIAVIDGGFQITNQDIDDNIFINTAEQRNGIDDDGNGYIDDINGWSFLGKSDDVGSLGGNIRHGLSVAGLVAAEENGTQVVGVCPQCQLLLIQQKAIPTINDLAEGIYYARSRGADIITNSWGRNDNSFEQPVLITAIDDVANMSHGGRGTPIFFAAGNSGGSIKNRIHYPARDPNTIAIGGSDCTDVRSLFSQYSGELNVLAPTDQGTVNNKSCGLVTTGRSNSIDNKFGGTSGATPIAAGIAGLMLSVNPDLTRDQVRIILERTADKIDETNANYDPITGFSNTHGHGRVNAHNAVVAAIPGKIIVNNDEWTLSDNGGFTHTPDDAHQFALNIADNFTNRSRSNFLVYSTVFGANNGLTGDKLRNTMEDAGHKWTIISTNTDFSVNDLLHYDGIFLAGYADDSAPRAQRKVA